MLPMAYPFAEGKQAMHRVCKFNGDVVLYHNVKSSQTLGGGKNYLVYSLWVLQIKDCNVLLSHTYDHEGVYDVKTVAPIRQIYRAYGGR